MLCSLAVLLQLAGTAGPPAGCIGVLGSEGVPFALFQSPVDSRGLPALSAPQGRAEVCVKWPKTPSAEIKYPPPLPRNLH